MYCAPFDYVPATSLDEVVQALQEHGDDATILAGGQSLIPMMSLRLATPEVLIDIARLDWAAPAVDEQSVTLSAGTTHSQIIAAPELFEALPLLRRVGHHIGNIRVRNRGTIGGSVAHADPAAEWPCLLTALDAVIGLQGPTGRREVPATSFFHGFLSTARDDDEVVVDITIPRRHGATYGYAQMARRANDFSVVQVTAVHHQGDQGSQVRLAFAGMGQTPVTTTPAEEAALGGLAASDGDRDEWLRAIVGRLEPSGDDHTPAAFRTHLALTLGHRALIDARNEVTS